MHAHVEDFHFIVHKRLDVMTIIEHCHSSNVGNMNRSLIFSSLQPALTPFLDNKKLACLLKNRNDARLCLKNYPHIYVYDKQCTNAHNVQHSRTWQEPLT